MKASSLNSIYYEYKIKILTIYKSRKSTNSGAEGEYRPS